MISLCPVGPGDRALIADIQARCADYMALETGQMPGPAHVEEFLTDAPPGLPADQVFALVVFDGDTPVGLLGWSHGYPGPQDAYIGLLMLIPAARGRGIGAQVLAQIGAQTQSRGCTRLLLCVFHDNPAALRFWRAQGFRHRQTTPPAAFGEKIHVRDELFLTLPHVAATEN